MNLLRYVFSVIVLTALVACGGGGGNPGTSSGAPLPAASAPAVSTAPSVSLELKNSANATSSTVSALDTFTLRATVKNSSGLALAGQVVKFAGDASLFKFSSTNGAGLTDANGVASVQVSPALATSSGAGVITADVTVAGKAATQATLGVQVVPSDTGSAPAAIDILASGNSLNSAPGSLINFILTVKDRVNTALPNQTVAFTSSSGTLTGANPSPATNVAGTISTVTLSPGADASNRSITVTASSGGVAKSIVVPVVGTTVAVSGPGAALVGSGPQNFTVKAVDSSGKPIVGASLAITSALANGISPQTVTTDGSGAATVAFTASNVGADTLTVTGLGTSGKATTIVSNVDFSFTAPAPAALLPVGTLSPVTVLYRVAGAGVAGQTVTFGSTRGSLSATTAVTDVNGVASVNVSSATAGPVTVSAQLGTARSSLTATFVSTVPATLVLQANPAAVLPNAVGSTTNQSALTAVVRDAAGNPVQGMVVNFAATMDGSNGSIAPGSVTTDANGLATSQFIAGPLSTAANGVQVKATLQQDTTISNTAALTVNGEAQFIAIGHSGTVDGNDLTTYKKDFSVYVTDANGAPAGNRAVTLSVWPTTYKKGSLSYNIQTGLWVYTVGSPTICANEDANRNGILDPGEDLNGDRILQPGIPAVITSSVTTDALGFAPFTLRYGKNFAWWVSVEITAKSLVGGTESKQIQSYDLEMTIDDAKAVASPANVVSPFGTANVCTNPR